MGGSMIVTKKLSCLTGFSRKKCSSMRSIAAQPSAPKRALR